MTNETGLMTGGKKTVTELLIILLCYLLTVTGVLIYFGGQRKWELLFAFLTGAMLTGAASAMVYLTVPEILRVKRGRGLYEILSRFQDTVLFRYDCASGNITMTGNEAGQIDRSLLRSFLQKYEKHPPAKGETIVFEFRMKDQDQAYHWCFCRLRAEYGRAPGRLIRLIGKLDDISDQKTREEQLLIQSTRDGLTGTYNKTAFEFLMDETLKKSGGGWLYMMDIDNFKEINDTCGHSAGDKILAAVGRTLRDIFKESALIGRIGGDEFMVYTREEEPLKQAEELLKTISGYKPETGHEVFLSIGITAVDGNKEEAFEQVFSRADQAMYLAKEEGKNRLAFYKDPGDKETGASRVDSG